MATRRNKSAKAAILSRLLAMVSIDPETQCWNWQGAKTAEGYGKIKVDGETQRAHRVSYELHKRRIGAGKVIRHKCDNPSCVNPTHLVAGTQAQNVADIVRRGRMNPASLQNLVQYRKAA